MDHDPALIDHLRAAPRACYVPIMPSGSPWTSARVGEQLVAAFGRLPDRPVLSRAGGFAIDGREVEPFGWPERFVTDPWDRRVLMTWARCRAIGASVSERYRDLGWRRSTAEDRRRRALDAIASGLNAHATLNECLTAASLAPEPA